MPNSLELLEAQALKLSPQDRAQLADRLISSLSDDPSVEESWAKEVERRVADIESGRSELIPASESIARARAAIK